MGLCQIGFSLRAPWLASPQGWHIPVAGLFIVPARPLRRSSLELVSLHRVQTRLVVLSLYVGWQYSFSLLLEGYPCLCITCLLVRSLKRVIRTHGMDSV